MANTELTTISRKDYKDAIAPFSPAVRAEIDKAIALANDFAKAHGEEATRLAIQRAIALYHIAEDKEAVKKAGFKTFKDLAAVLFNLGSSSATNYRSAAEQFYCNDKAPKVKEWFGPSGLYEFIRGGITNEAIAAAIDRGEIKPTMTNSEIRAWVDKQKALAGDEEEDGNAKIAKLYDGFVVAIGGLDGNDYTRCKGTLSGATEDEIKASLKLAIAKCIYGDEADKATEYAAGIDDDRIGRFNPHAEMDNGKRKTAGKGLFAVSGEVMAKAVYFPATKAKAKSAKQPTPPNYAAAAENMTDEEFEAFVAARKAAKAKAAQNAQA